MTLACPRCRKVVLSVAVATLAATTLALPAGALGRTPRGTAATTVTWCPVAPGANNATVRLGYLTLLYRCPDPGGLTYWAGVLAKPNGQALFASALANSDESLHDWVDFAYESTVAHVADPGGLTYWTSRLRSGLRWDQLEATLFATDGVYAMTNRSNPQFVKNLYSSIFGRDADIGGLTYWTSRLNAGASRYSVAWAFETNSEAELRWGFQFASVMLGQPAPTKNEQIFFGANVRLTGDPYKVQGGVAAMPEFASYAQTLPNG